MKALVISIAVLVLVGAATGLTLVYAQGRATRLPANSPTNYLRSEAPPTERSVAVFAGDSLTHAAVSANYIDALASTLDERSLNRFEFVNAGINSELSYNLLLRLDDIIACDPDFVFVLIGTNDANAMLSTENLERYMDEQSLPREPDADWYRQNLGIIASRLQLETDAVVAFLSLPPIGEDPDDPAYRLSKEYSGIVMETTAEQGISYLPLFETMDAYLNEKPGNPRYDYSQTRLLMVKGVMKHYLLGQSWNRIGEDNGFVLHTDFLHLNNTGAGMAAELIADFLQEHAD